MLHHQLQYGRLYKTLELMNNKDSVRERLSTMDRQRIRFLVRYFDNVCQRLPDVVPDQTIVDAAIELIDSFLSIAKKEVNE